MITVRRATLGDVPTLVELMQAFYADYGFPLDHRWAADSFRALLDDDRRGAIWIASDGNAPAGYIVLTVRHSMEFGGLDGFIDDFYVRPAYRRRGLGRSAINALLAECERRDLKALHVEAVREKTVARELYESIGLGVADDKRQTLTLRFDALAR